MVFSSITFIFYFLPAVLAVYHLLFLPVTLGRAVNFWRSAANFLLLVTSLLFYFWGENFLVWILLTTTTFDYVCGLLIAGGFSRRPLECLSPDGPRTGWQRFVLVASVCTNLAFLGFFKYFNFGVDNYNRLMGVFGLSALQWQDVLHVTLPLGISFYTFQSMSYTIDVYRGHVCATRSFLDFACYVTMFPQLVAGPIVRYSDIAEQLVDRRVTTEIFASGVSRFVVGLAKKVLIANVAAVPADRIFALPAAELTPAIAWLGCLAFTLQVYFDFSGYSDMAIGLGRMFGFSFLENFNYSYVSQSIREVWRRWHISLATWFRDYLYFPLGGNRISDARTYFNLVLVVFLCGLWHGANWTFVFWGLHHGLFLVIERAGFEKVLARVWRPFRHAYAMLVFMIGVVFFRADTLTHACGYLGAMVGLTGGDPLRHPLLMYLQPDDALALVVGSFGSTPIVPALRQWLRSIVESRTSGALRSVADVSGYVAIAVLCTLMILSAMRLATDVYNPFIYFRF